MAPLCAAYIHCRSVNYQQDTVKDTVAIDIYALKRPSVFSPSNFSHNLRVNLIMDKQPHNISLEQKS